MEGRARCAKFPFMSVSGGIVPIWVSPLSRVRPLFRSSPFSGFPGSLEAFHSVLVGRSAARSFSLTFGLKRNLSLELRDPWDLFPRFLFPAMGVLRAFHRVFGVGSRLSQNGMSDWKKSEDLFFLFLKPSRIESAFANPKGRKYAAFHDSIMSSTSVKFSSFINIGTHKSLFDHISESRIKFPVPSIADCVSFIKFLEPSISEFAKKLVLEPSTLSFLESDVILEPPLSLVSDVDFSSRFPSFSSKSSLSDKVAFAHPPFSDAQCVDGSGGVDEGPGPDVNLVPLSHSDKRSNIALGCLLAASGCFLGGSKNHVSCVEGDEDNPTQLESPANPVLFLKNKQGERFDLVAEEIHSISEAVISCFLRVGFDASDRAAVKLREKTAEHPVIALMTEFFTDMGEAENPNQTPSILDVRAHILSDDCSMSALKTSVEKMFDGIHITKGKTLFKNMITLLQIPAVTGSEVFSRGVNQGFVPNLPPAQTAAAGTLGLSNFEESARMFFLIQEQQQKQQNMETPIHDLLSTVGDLKKPTAIKDFNRNATVPLHPEFDKFEDDDVLPKVLVLAVIQKQDRSHPFNCFPKGDEPLPATCVLESNREVLMRHPNNKGDFTVAWLKFESSFWWRALRRYLLIFSYVFNVPGDPLSGFAIFSWDTVDKYTKVLKVLLREKVFSYVRDYDQELRQTIFKLIAPLERKEKGIQGEFRDLITPYLIELHAPTVEKLDRLIDLKKLVDEKFAIEHSRNAKRGTDGEAIPPTKRQRPEATPKAAPAASPKATITNPPAAQPAPGGGPHLKPKERKYVVENGPANGIPYYSKTHKKWVDLSSPELGGPSWGGPALDVNGIPVHFSSFHAENLCQANEDLKGRQSKGDGGGKFGAKGGKGGGKGGKGKGKGKDGAPDPKVEPAPNGPP